MSNPLVAFALVADEYERSGDPIKGLSPLFRPLLAEQSGHIFDPGLFAQAFSKTYGLEMTEFVARALRERMEEIGLLTREDPRSDKFFVSKFDPNNQGNFGFDESKIEEIVDVFSKWASVETTRLGRTVSKAELEEALLSRLARPEFSSVFLDGIAKRDSARIKKLLGKGGIDPEAKVGHLFDYLVARFILTSSESAPEVFDALSSIAFGSLIADAIAGLANSGIKEMPDPPLRVIVDGPLILDVLGLNAIAHKQYADGFFDLMRKANLRLATFDHIVDEVRDSIRSVLKAYASKTEYGPLGERLRSTPGFSMLATNIADSLEDRLAELEITVLRSELYDRADFKKFFSDEAFDNMRNAIGEVHHQIERRIRDTKSVAAVIRLKKENRKPSSVFRSGTLFVTRNSALCKKVNYVLSLSKTEPDPRFTIATDGQFGGVLWFSFGSPKGYAELSRKRLISNCATAIIPQREVIQRIADLLERMDPVLKEEFSTLMRDQRASMCPMRITGGLVDQIDDEASFRILDAMRESIAAPIQEAAAAKEELALEVRRELEGELSQSRGVSAALQENLAVQELNFNEQLAQLSLDMAGEKSARERIRAEIQRRRNQRNDQLSAEQSALILRRARIVTCLRCLWVSASLAAIAATFFLGRIDQVWVLVIVFLLLASGLSVFTSSIDKFFNWIASYCFSSHERRVAVIRSHVSEMDELLASDE